MAKKNDAIAEAKQALARAEKEYEKLVKKKGPVSDHEKHTADCQKALAAKRLARATLDNLQKGLPVPKAEDAVETQVLSESSK